MPKARFDPEVTSYIASITACETGQQRGTKSCISAGGFRRNGLCRMWPPVVQSAVASDKRFQWKKVFALFWRCENIDPIRICTPTRYSASIIVCWAGLTVGENPRVDAGYCIGEENFAETV